MAKKATIPLVEVAPQEEEDNPYIKRNIPIGELIDLLDDNRTTRRPLEAALKPLDKDYTLIKEAILIKLVEQKLEKQGTTKATVSVSRVTIPVIDDMEAATTWLKRNKMMHIFLKQPFSTPSWREIVGRKRGDLPGTHTFTKVDLNHSSIKS